MNSNNETWGFYVDIEKTTYEPTIDFDSLEITELNKRNNVIIIYNLIKITSNIIFFIGASYLIFYII